MTVLPARRVHAGGAQDAEGPGIDAEERRLARTVEVAACKRGRRRNGVTLTSRRIALLPVSNRHCLETAASSTM
jgi:hypothetical protein